MSLKWQQGKASCILWPETDRGRGSEDVAYTRAPLNAFPSKLWQNIPTDVSDGGWSQLYLLRFNFFLIMFCCLSCSFCHPSTFLFGFHSVLSDGEVVMNIDEMDLYLAICSSWMKSTRHLGLQSSTRTSCYFTPQIPYTPNSISTFNVIDFGWQTAVTSILTLVLLLHRLQQIAFGSAM